MSARGIVTHGRIVFYRVQDIKQAKKEKRFFRNRFFNIMQKAKINRNKKSAIWRFYFSL
jgi:hypothetical protein